MVFYQEFFIFDQARHGFRIIKIFYISTHYFLEVRHTMVQLFHYSCCLQNTQNLFSYKGTRQTLLSYQYIRRL